MNTKLRYNEYYDMQETFDMLYDKSRKNDLFGINLFDIITAEPNILLAYRTIKANTGSKTAGTDGITIENYKMEDKEQFIHEIRLTLEHYKPDSVRHVEIPKPNGKVRPLGIPTMRDRIIQQMFKQVLEPICEAKFYQHSYGFRPNRSTHHAMARCQSLINKTSNHYVVDVDIEGFFDNVNHRKLIDQMWNIGIKDRRVLTVVSKMLKAPIKGVGRPMKGTPQGGILSPLLSNIVLNDLDWWISNQWETFKTKHAYSHRHKYRAIKTTNLKEMFIVRYADDFKVFTNSPKSAEKIFHAVKGYLKEHLGLNISKEKSTITNLRKRSSDFLGFKMKAIKKSKKYVANTHIMDKKAKHIVSELKKAIMEIQKQRTPQNIRNYNSKVLGMQNYYKGATHVNVDFSKIAFLLIKTLYNRLKSIGKYSIPDKPSEVYKQFYKNNYKTFEIAGIHLFPIADIQTTNLMNFSQDICNYTIQGREKLNKELKTDIKQVITDMLNRLSFIRDMEYNDNRISKYSMQRGKCAITGSVLFAEEVHCHHIMPKHLGGTDKFDNLVVVHKGIHKLIHATDKETVERYLQIFKLKENQIKKLNKYRKECNLRLV